MAQQGMVRSQGAFEVAWTCLKGSDGHFGATVECLGDPGFPMQEAALSMARLGGNSGASLVPDACPTLELLVRYTYPPNSVIFAFA